MSSIFTTKADLQKQVEELQAEIERLASLNKTLHADNESIQRDLEKTRKNCEPLNTALSETKKELDQSKKQAAEYKRELDGLTDTKAVLDKLMSILRSPHNDYQKVVNELSGAYDQEKSRAYALEQELRNIQFDIQRNQFLEGKVQAYEAMFRVNPVRAEREEGERMGSTNEL